MNEDDQARFAHAERLRRIAVHHRDLMRRIEAELDDLGEPVSDWARGYTLALEWVLRGAPGAEQP